MGRGRKGLFGKPEVPIHGSVTKRAGKLFETGRKRLGKMSGAPAVSDGAVMEMFIIGEKEAREVLESARADHAEEDEPRSRPG